MRLKDREIYWRDHQVWLQECGYMLRPRYLPSWIPSWKTDPTKVDLFCEDGIPLSGNQPMDAIRIEDGASVVLKVVSKSEHPDEARIFQYFSSPELASDARNHCLPLLAQLSPPDDEDKVIFVMKLMRKYDSPRFDTFGEVVEFFRQMFEGVQFMHQHRVAHRDCNANNIMMDGQHLFPDGFHPQNPVYKPGTPTFQKAKHYTRTQQPVKYYFIDFGLSSKFEPGQDTRVHPLEGGDKTVPEFRFREAMRDPTIKFYPLDPFPTDIYYLGNLIRTEFLEGAPKRGISAKFGFNFMKPLVSDMVQADPAKRPTIDEVVERFEKIQKKLSWWKLRSRVIKKTEITIFHPKRVMDHWLRRVRFVFRRVPAIPTPPTPTT
ncbi:kinase-like domain-containing protein [Mycena leptocephala]|nr:kinase-like domain-containing protein [Mycena leptocephala]